MDSLWLKAIRDIAGSADENLPQFMKNVMFVKKELNIIRQHVDNLPNNNEINDTNSLGDAIASYNILFLKHFVKVSEVQTSIEQIFTSMDFSNAENRLLYGNNGIVRKRISMMKGLRKQFEVLKQEFHGRWEQIGEKYGQCEVGNSSFSRTDQNLIGKLALEKSLHELEALCIEMGQQSEDDVSSTVAEVHNQAAQIAQMIGRCKLSTALIVFIIVLIVVVFGLSLKITSSHS